MYAVWALGSSALLSTRADAERPLAGAFGRAAAAPGTAPTHAVPQTSQRPADMSRFGVTVNEQRIEKEAPTPLAAGDTLKLAHYTKVNS